MKLEPLELQVLKKLLEGSHPTLSGLRAQLENLEVVSREYSGTGFFTEFTQSDVRKTGMPIPLSIRFGDVEASVPGLKNGAGFLLYVEGGYIKMLEGYTYGEDWPENAEEFSLRYHDDNRAKVLRDLS